MNFCSGSHGRSLQAGLGVRPDHSILELAIVQRWRCLRPPAFADWYSRTRLVSCWDSHCHIRSGRNICLSPWIVELFHVPHCVSLWGKRKMLGGSSWHSSCKSRQQTLQATVLREMDDERRCLKLLTVFLLRSAVWTDKWNSQHLMIDKGLVVLSNNNRLLLCINKVSRMWRTRVQVGIEILNVSCASGTRRDKRSIQSNLSFCSWVTVMNNNKKKMHLWNNLMTERGWPPGLLEINRN